MIKRVLYSIPIICILVILTGSSNLLRLDFSGFNGLYIAQQNNQKTINWITSVSDTGVYKISQGNKIITEGTTTYGKVHSVEVENPESSYVLSFGGKRTGMHTIPIRSIKKQEKAIYKNVDSIYVLGDIHGEYDDLVKILKASNIVNDDLHWTAGKAHLVFLGDLFDRGKKVTKLLWFIYKLEQEAEMDGGKVHVVLGNHEIMVMTKDLRYVSVKERGIAVAHKTTYDQLFHPTNSILGNWLKHKTSVMKINSVLFAHGGIMNMETKDLSKFNTQALSYMNDTNIFLDLIADQPNSTKYDPKKWIEMRNFFFNQNNPYWFRGYVRSNEFEKDLDKTLKRFKSDLHVVGHTALSAIATKYNAKLIATDLHRPATEILLMVQNSPSPTNFSIDQAGNKKEL
ncbi:MAG: hypothetical protein CMB99_14315 [Flavobacteriaceae bacterium]|nr:hypothetical protein [Flavobacteriaceae bacterium]|tara:strand:- start:157079 stop:158275 length:1197 start_codon:yes stop_codon:yes gene_type:complete